MIGGNEPTRIIDHGGAMAKIGVLRLLSYMLQLQIWMQHTVLMLQPKIVLLRILPGAILMLMTRLMIVMLIVVISVTLVALIIDVIIPFPVDPNQ